MITRQDIINTIEKAKRKTNRINPEVESSFYTKQTIEQTCRNCISNLIKMFREEERRKSS